jgi:protoheme IX farnesyltransferase
MEQLKTYYQLTKPGIVYGNAITAIGGFLLASGRHIHLITGVSMLIGICLVMASGCVSNNYLDRNIDRRMARTKTRALVQGTVSGRAALTYSAALGIVGALLLALGTNLLTVGLAVGGWVAYVVLYGIGKRRSVHGTEIGSISGAVPPVVGYCAASGRFDPGALILFAILVCWQMPHFYAIAIYRSKEYAAAGIPILPLKKDLRTTKIRMLIYIVAFILAAASLTITGHAGISYLVVMVLLGLIWLGRGLKGFKAPDDNRWARRLFGFSLIVILLFSVMISLNAWLP